MFRRLPILLIVLTAATGARAQQNFFDQFFGSLKTNGPAASDSVGDTAGSVPGDSEPLALQPTVTRPHYKKRTHATQRHHESIPEHHRQARPEPRRAEQEKAAEKKQPASPTASPEVARPPSPAADVAPADVEVAPANVNVTPPAAWPDPAPPAVAPWPAERAPVDSMQTAQPDDAQNEAPPQALKTADDLREYTQGIEPREPRSFIDRERNALAGFSAAWLVLGIVMFILRRPIAKVIDARRRPILRTEPPRIPARLPSAPQLTLILANAERDDPVVDKNDEELGGERRALSIG